MFDLIVPSYLFAEANRAPLNSIYCNRQCQKLAPAEGLYDLVLRLFGYSPGTYGVANLRAEFDQLEASVDWICADPFSFAVDMTTAYAMGQGELTLSQSEADAYVDYLNSCLPDWAQIRAAQPLRWYLQLPKDLLLTCVEPAQVIGKQLLNCLPKGEDRNLLIGQFNDIQMLLHSCDLNQQRRALQKPTIDGLWLWGNGDKVPQLKSPAIQNVITNDPIVYQLAQRNKIAQNTFNNQPLSLLSQSTTGLVVDNPSSCSALSVDQHLEQACVNRRLLRCLYTADGGYYEEKRWYQKIVSLLCPGKILAV